MRNLEMTMDEVETIYSVLIEKRLRLLAKMQGLNLEIEASSPLVDRSSLYNRLYNLSSRLDDISSLAATFEELQCVTEDEM